MSIYTRVRAEDVRALAGAIVLGSSVGLAFGGACLLGGPSRPTQMAALPAAAGFVRAGSATPVQPPLTPSAPITGSNPRGPQGFVQALRDRFRLGVPSSAKPFAFAKVAAAPTDLHCLAETVYFEARGESDAGQKAVAQVVLNRVRHPAFPKTICGVVHQRTASGCQFSFACSDREAATDSVAWRRAQSVASAALHGAVMAAVGDATHFQTSRSGAFSGLLEVARIGAHVFYRFAGHEGSPAMLRQTPTPSVVLARAEPGRRDEPKAQGSKLDDAKIELARLDTSAPLKITAVAARPADPSPAGPKTGTFTPSARPAVATLALPSPLADLKPPAVVRSAAPASAQPKPSATPAAKPAATVLALAQS